MHSAPQPVDESTSSLRSVGGKPVVAFYGKKGDYGFMANTFVLKDMDAPLPPNIAAKMTSQQHQNWGTRCMPIEMNGELYRTSENYFQSQKANFFIKPATQSTADFNKKVNEYKEWVRNYPGPEDIKKGVGLASFPRQAKAKMAELGLSIDSARWDAANEGIMAAAVRAKIAQYPWIQKKLDELPASTPVVESTRNDTQWADGGDGSGKNKLGKIWMEELRKRKGDPQFPPGTVGRDYSNFNVFRQNTIGTNSLHSCPSMSISQLQAKQAATPAARTAVSFSPGSSTFQQRTQQMQQRATDRTKMQIGVIIDSIINCQEAKAAAAGIQTEFKTSSPPLICPGMREGTLKLAFESDADARKFFDDPKNKSKFGGGMTYWAGQGEEKFPVKGRQFIVRIENPIVDALKITSMTQQSLDKIMKPWVSLDSPLKEAIKSSPDPARFKEVRDQIMAIPDKNVRAEMQQALTKFINTSATAGRGYDMERAVSLMDPILNANKDKLSTDFSKDLFDKIQEASRPTHALGR